MAEYLAPLGEIRFALRDLAGLDGDLAVIGARQRAAIDALEMPDDSF